MASVNSLYMGLTFSPGSYCHANVYSNHGNHKLIYHTLSCIITHHPDQGFITHYHCYSVLPQSISPFALCLHLSCNAGTDHQHNI